MRNGWQRHGKVCLQLLSVVGRLTQSWPHGAVYGGVRLQNSPRYKMSEPPGKKSAMFENSA